jgi:hypothetical protein
MTVTEQQELFHVEEPEPNHWTLHDVASFLATDRHTFHLTGETFSFTDWAGKHVYETMRATCTCGVVIGGLTTAEDVFAIIREHCQPL